MAHSNPIINKAAIFAAVKRVKARNFPSIGIDQLVALSDERVRFGLTVAVDAGTITATAAKAFASKLNRLLDDNADIVSQIDNACRAAMAARKEGLLSSKPKKSKTGGNHA